MNSPEKVSSRAEHKHHNPLHTNNSGPKRNRSVGPVDVDTDELSRKGQRKDDMSRRVAPPTPPLVASNNAGTHDRFASVIGSGSASTTKQPKAVSSITNVLAQGHDTHQQSDNAKPEVLLVVPKQHPPPLVDLDTQVQRDLRFPTPLSDEVEEVGTIYPMVAAPIRRTHQPYSSAYSGYFNYGGSAGPYGGSGGAYHGSQPVGSYIPYYPTNNIFRPPSYPATGYVTQDSYRSTSASHSQARRSSDPLSAPPSYSTLGLSPQIATDDSQPLDTSPPDGTSAKPSDASHYEYQIAVMSAEIDRLQSDNRRLREALDISRRSCAELEKLYGRRSGDVIRLQAQLRNSVVARNTSPAPMSTLSSEDWTDPTAPPPQPLPPPQLSSNTSVVSQPSWARNLEDAAAVTSVVVHPSTQSKRYYCEVCNVLVNSEVSLKAHLEGDKHRKGQYRLQYRRGGAGLVTSSQSLPMSDTNCAETPTTSEQQ